MGDSKYNERREECETALSEIQVGMGINTFGDLDEQLFEQIKMAIKDEDRRKRARHAVYENRRADGKQQKLLSAKVYREVFGVSSIIFRFHGSISNFSPTFTGQFSINSNPVFPS